MDEATIQRILENQSIIISDLKTISENQSSMFDDFKTIEEKQSVMIIGNDLMNNHMKASNIGSMMIVLLLGILVGIGFVSFLKGGKK